MTFTAQSTMAELLDLYPGAALALFERYRVGNRDRYGFGRDEPLHQVLRRHLVFDLEGAVGYLRDCLEAERRLELDPSEVGAFLGARGMLLDARGAEEHELVSLPGSRLLEGRLAREAARDQPLAFCCHTGTVSGAAARVFASLGFERLAIVRGGMEAWSRRWDPDLPRYGAAEDLPGTCRILPALEQLRFTLRQEVFPAWPATLSRRDPVLPWAQRLFQAVPDLEKVVLARSFLTACRTRSTGWGDVARVIAAELRGLREPTTFPGKGTARSQAELRAQIVRLLAQEVNPALSGHKGFAELVGLTDLVAEIRMGGGCHGCSSVEITVAREIAGVLHRHVPELLGVRDVSRHETATDPYRGGERPPWQSTEAP